MQFGDRGAHRRKPRGSHLAGVGIDQQRRADLDDDTAKILELGGSSLRGSHGFDRMKRSAGQAIRATSVIGKWRGLGKVTSAQPITKALSLLPSRSRK